MLAVRYWSSRDTFTASSHDVLCAAVCFCSDRLGNAFLSLTALSFDIVLQFGVWLLRYFFHTLSLNSAMLGTVNAARSIKGRLRAGSADIVRHADKKSALNRSMQSQSLPITPPAGVLLHRRGSTSSATGSRKSNDQYRRGRAMFSTNVQPGQGIHLPFSFRVFLHSKRRRLTLELNTSTLYKRNRITNKI